MKTCAEKIIKFVIIVKVFGVVFFKTFGDIKLKNIKAH